MRFHTLAALALTAATGSAQVRAPFDAPLVVADEYKQIVKTLDLNGDGWMDAFGWWTDSQYGAHPGQGEMHGWINDGAGNLALAWNVPYGNSVYDGFPSDVCATGDLDGDGDDDFVILANGRVRVYLSNGSQPPTLALNPVGPFAGSTNCVAIADFDHDGLPEIVLAGGAMIGIYGIDFANGALVARSLVQSSFTAEGKLIVAELTGDNELDVLLTGTRVHPVVNGQLQPWAFNFALPWGFSPEESRRFDAGDLDGDGDLDLVAFTVNLYTGAARYRVVRRTGPGTWSQEPSRDGGPARMLADVDGDGDLDGVCCGGGGGSPERSINNSNASFRIALNDGSGTFAAAIAIPSVGSLAIAGAVDLDHDGDLDLVGGRCVLYAQGAISGPTSTLIGAGAQDPRTVVDLDADGDLDFEPTLQGVRRNRGDGVTELVPLDLPPSIAGTVREGDPIPGDWDGDGDLDLLCRLQGAAGLELVRNLGSGRFASGGLACGPAGLANFPTSAVDALVEDMDGDGDQDLVLRTRSALLADGQKSAWWSNDGAGVFTWRETFSAQCLAHVADMDGNGIPDLLAHTVGTTGNPYPLSWSPGLGSGAFGAWVAIPNTSARSAGDRFAVADFDGDGDLDLAAPYTSLLRSYLYENDGLGNLVRLDLGLPNLASSAALSAVAGDMNGDGLEDFVFGPVKNAANGVFVLLRRSDNLGWQAPISQMVFQSGALGFTLSDPDGDGDLDLLSDRFVRNTAHQGDDAGRRLQVFDGQAGQGGIVPLFGAEGPFRVGETAQLRLRGLRPGAIGRVVVSYPSDPPPTFGGMHAATRHRIFSEIHFTASGVAGGEAGSGSWSLDYTVPGYSAGRTKCYTAFVEDADALGGQARSNHLYITYGP
ncbi:MAG: VCBS repeat-containing protein [Planctomycetota bacterium]|nr:VCBS repeat-containing protein [Planctomycetota bacterium]